MDNFGQDITAAMRDGQQKVIQYFYHDVSLQMFSSSLFILFFLLSMENITGNYTLRNRTFLTPLLALDDKVAFNTALKYPISVARKRNFILAATFLPTSQPTFIPSIQPSLQPLKKPSRQPSRRPSVQPTGQPRKKPSSQPSRKPLRYPSSQPSFHPTTQPVRRPWRNPTSQPLRRPSRQPTLQPLSHPTYQPSRKPVRIPSSQPARRPSRQPSKQPMRIPSSQPARYPSRQPSKQPARVPSLQPSTKPIRKPSKQPSRRPTNQPVRKPSRCPTSQPQFHPTCQPTRQPIRKPSSQPTKQPSIRPSIFPMGVPTQQPSGYPTTRSSNQPSTIPSVTPTIYPTDIPSHQPTRNPTRKPSCQPSLSPTRQPSACPSSPTGQPSGIPSGPSSQPSSNPSTPSRVPSTQPSRQPSIRPVVRHPSRQPSKQPTAQPRRRPSRQPNSKPSRQPSKQPSRWPSSQPLHFPSTCPSNQPTSTPSVTPTSMPTIYGKACRLSTYYDPTSNKCKPCQSNSNSFTLGSTTCTCNAGYTQTGTKNSLQCRACPAGYTSTVGASVCTICRAGYYSKVRGSSKCTICDAGRISTFDGSSNCTLCPRGKYSPLAGATTCLSAPIGSFAKSEGSTRYKLCDQGTYCSLYAQATCISCSSGTVTARFGSTSSDECVSPNANFLLGYFCLVFAAIMGLVYVVFGRFHILSFERQAFYVYPATEKILSIILKLKNAIKLLTEEVTRNRPQSELSAGEKVFIWTMVLVTTIFGAIAGFLISVGQIVFFNLIIGWYSLNLGPLSEMFDTFTNLIQQVGDTIYIPPSVVAALLYPLQLEYQLAELLKIDNFYTMLPAPCLGAKAPIELFIDGFILTMAILFIQSNYNFIWAMTLREMDQKLLIKNWMERKTVFSIYLPALSFMCILTYTNPFTIFLRFFLSFVNYGVFFVNNHVTHSLSQACVGIEGFENHELVLAYASTVLTWGMIPPMVYVMAGILCPKGGYTNTRRVRPLPPRGWEDASEDDNSSLSSNSVGNAAGPDLNENDYVGTGSENNEFRLPAPVVTTDSVEDPSVSPPPDSTNLAILGFWRYTLDIFSVDLIVIYAINLWVARCDRSNEERESDQQPAVEETAVDDPPETEQLDSPETEQVDSSSWQKFVHYFSQYEIRARAEKKKHSAAMAQLDTIRQPPYYSLCFQVQQEMDKEIRLLLGFGLFSLIVSYSFAYSSLGHVFTAVGRKHWVIAIWKYFLFACVCAGIWTDEIYEAYEVTDLVIRFTSNHRGIVFGFIPLIVICRAILLQALGRTTTLISIIVVCTCSAPLFVVSPKLRALIPPLWYSNSREVAMRRERREQRVRDPESLEGNAAVENWVIGMRSASIFLSESRLVVFIASAIPATIAIMILLKADVNYKVYVILLIGIIPYVVGLTLIPILYVGKRLEIKDKDFLVLGLGSCFRLGSNVGMVCAIVTSTIVAVVISPIGRVATYLASHVAHLAHTIFIRLSLCMQWQKQQQTTIVERDISVTAPADVRFSTQSYDSNVQISGDDYEGEEDEEEGGGGDEEDVQVGGRSSVNVTEEVSDERGQLVRISSQNSAYLIEDRSRDDANSGIGRVSEEYENYRLPEDADERRYVEEYHTGTDAPISFDGFVLVPEQRVESSVRILPRQESELSFAISEEDIDN